MPIYITTRLCTFSVVMIQTKGVKVNILESLTPYSLWNEYRSRYTDMYKKPSKVLVHMNNFEEIYLELLSEFRFGEFYQDYMEVHSRCVGENALNI